MTTERTLLKTALQRTTEQMQQLLLLSSMKENGEQERPPAPDTVPGLTPDTEPRGLRQLQERWRARGEALKEGTMIAHQRTQDYLLFLLEGEPEKFWDHFKEVAAAKKWKVSTQVSYLHHLWTPAKTSHPAMLAEIKKAVTALQKIGTQELSWTGTEEYMSPEEMAPLWTKAQHDRWALAALVTGVLGQRMGDVLKMRRCGVMEECIYLTETKTGLAYALHLDPRVLTLVQALNKTLTTDAVDYPFLFLDQQRMQQNEKIRDYRQRISKAVLHAERAVRRMIPKGVRALRRGGLIAASKVLPDEDVLRLSRHASMGMLQKYLGAGRYSTTETRIGLAASGVMVDAMLAKLTETPSGTSLAEGRPK